MTKTTKKYHGVIVPMITPFTAEGELDERSLRKILDHLIAGKVQGILAAGTNGEGPSISWRLRRRLMEICVEHSAGRLQIYAGIGHCCLSEQAEAACEYMQVGVDAIVAHVPFYFPLSPAEQLEYFRRLAEKISGPVLVYNIPTTTGMCIPLEVIEKFRKVSNIVGVKDSVMDLERLGKLFCLYKDDVDFSVFSGASVLSAKALEMGADGIIPSVGNLEPKLCTDLYLAARNGDYQKAEQLQERLSTLNRIYLGNRPTIKSISLLKTAMNLKGLGEMNFVPPMVEPEKEEQEAVREEMIEFGLLQELK